MPVPKKIKMQIKRSVNKEYKNLSLKRRNYIANAIIYHRLGYGKKKK